MWHSSRDEKPSVGVVVLTKTYAGNVHTACLLPNPAAGNGVYWHDLYGSLWCLSSPEGESQTVLWAYPPVINKRWSEIIEYVKENWVL